MPEYSQIQTYVKCNKGSLSSTILQFVCVLEEIGFDEKFLADNFSDLKWEVDDDGIVYVGSNIETVRINLF